MEGDDAHSIPGTLAYMAPEVLQGDAADASSDVYSIGVLLFEMLVGRRPAGLELPSSHREDLVRLDWWDSLFYWCYQPGKSRYANAIQLVEAIRSGPKIHPLRASASPPQVILPEPAPLPSDEWAAFVLRWKEYERADRANRSACARTIEALKIFTEQNQEVVQLRSNEERLKDELSAARCRMRMTCAQLIESIKASDASHFQHKEQLLREGYRENHPDVARIALKIGPIESLIQQLNELGEQEPYVLLRKTNSAVVAAMLETMKACGVRRDNPGYEFFASRYRHPVAQARTARYTPQPLSAEQVRKEVGMLVIGAAVAGLLFLFFALAFG